MVSGAQDTLESPDEPGPVIADNNDPVVQEGEQLGSGVGDAERGDHVEEAVVRVTDKKDIAAHSGITDGAQPSTGVSVPEVEVPSSSLIQEPGDEKNDDSAIEKNDSYVKTTRSHEDAVQTAEPSSQHQIEPTEIVPIQESRNYTQSPQDTPLDETASPPENAEEVYKEPTSLAGADDNTQEASSVQPDTTQFLPIPSADNSPVQEPDIQPPSQTSDAPGSNPQDGNTEDIQATPPVRDGESISQPDGHNQPLDLVEIVEVELGTVDDDQDLQEVTKVPQIDEQSPSPPKMRKGDTLDQQQPHIDSDKPIERDKKDQEGSGLAQSSQYLETPEASQEPAHPAIGKQVPTSNALIDTLEVMPKPEVLVSGDQNESHQGLYQDVLQNISPEESAQQDTQQQESKPEKFSQSDVHQDALPEQRGAEHASYRALVKDNEQPVEPNLVSSADTEREKRPLEPVHEAIDEFQNPSTADMTTGTPDGETAAQPGVVDEGLPTSSTELDSPEAISPQHQDQIDKPSLGRADSSTQTDELWRPITPAQGGTTPGIVLPGLHDEQAKGTSRARSMRKRVRRGSRQVEEVVAAPGIIRAVADTVGETSASRAAVVKDLKQLGDTTAPANLPVDRRGTGVAVTDTPCGSTANSITGKESSKADDKVPRSPRAHRSSHSSRADRPSTRDGPNSDGAAKSSHHRHSSYKSRTDGERESEQNSPRTPIRRDTGDSTAQGSHSSRSRRDRTPQEQADHDRRKEERRLARQKDQEREITKSDSPVTEAKVKEAESPIATADRSHKSSRRHSSSRNVPDGSAPPVKKFFTGESVFESHFGDPLTADVAPSAIKDKDIATSRRSKDITRPPPAELKRSNTSRSARALRQSMEQSNSKSQKAQETGKPSKDKSRKREGSSSPAPSSGTDEKKGRFNDKHRKSRMEKREKEEKEEKKKSSGGIKGMFKKLFS